MVLPDSLRRRLTAGALHGLIASVVTFPMLLSPASRLVGHEDVDVWNHAWGAWWYWQSFSHGTLPFYTNLLMAPRTGPLWYIDPIGALLSCPLIPLFGVNVAYNAWIFAAVVLASIAARALARRIGATDDASWLASIAACGTPALTSEIHNGVSEAVGVAWGLFALGAAWKALNGGRWRDWIALGLWGGLTAVGSYYYAAATGLVIGLWGLVALGASLWRRVDALPIPRLLLGATLAAALAIGLVLPVVWAMNLSVGDLNSIVIRAPLRLEDQEMLLAHNAVDPRTFFWPGRFQSVDYAALGEAFRHSSYLGLLALGFAVASRRRLLLGSVLLSLVVGLGPWLFWDGHWVLVDGQRLALPFRALMHLLPSSSATHPQRMTYPAIAIVAALAAVRAGGFKRRTIALLGLGLAVDGLLIGPSPWPLARTPVLDLTAHESLARRPDVQFGQSRIGTVLDLPTQVGQTMATSRYLVYQTASGRPIPYRPDANGGTSSLMGVPSFWLLALPSTTRPQHRAVFENNIQKLDAGMVRDPTDLAQQGVAWVVVHRELERGEQHVAQVEDLLRTWYGEPEVLGDHAVYTTVRKND